MADFNGFQARDNAMQSPVLPAWVIIVSIVAAVGCTQRPDPERVAELMQRIEDRQRQLDKLGPAVQKQYDQARTTFLEDEQANAIAPEVGRAAWEKWESEEWPAIKAWADEKAAELKADIADARAQLVSEGIDPP